MMQNINLYLPEFRKKVDWLPLPRMAHIAASSLVLLAAISGLALWQNLRLERQLAALELDKNAAAEATAALLERYGAQTEDPLLLADIRKLEATLQSKEALLRFLGARDSGNSTGFSQHLAELSRFHVQGLSLSSVKLGNGGQSIQLAGQVLRTELVPQYLQNLSKGSSFATTRFETLQIRELPAIADSGMPAVWMFQVDSLAPAPER